MSGFGFAGPILTERLVLRAFTIADLDEVYAMQSDEESVRYLEWGPRSREEVAESLAKKMAATAIHGEGDSLSLAVILPETGKLVSDVVLQFVSAEHRRGEIGFIVHPDHGGEGYTTEASRELLRIAFEDLGLRRVIAQVESRNVACMRVLEKLGMRREAYFVENVFVKDEWQDEQIYAILEREWRAAGSGAPSPPVLGSG
jgi:RimJ/RimL family protein N-acetyltransferase